MVSKLALYGIILAGATVQAYDWYNNAMAFGAHERQVRCLTDQWVEKVTVENSPGEVYKMFANDATLVGTVSARLRRGQGIKQYFEYFAKLPGISVVDRKDNVQCVTERVYLNNAFITWKWDGLDNPITARMSFLFRGDEIVSLHSSVLPSPPNKLEGERRAE